MYGLRYFTLALAAKPADEVYRYTPGGLSRGIVWDDRVLGGEGEMFGGGFYSRFGCSKGISRLLNCDVLEY